MDELNNMTLDRFKMWSLQSLKVFLAARKKSLEGTFEELASRAFVAWEDNVTVDIDAEQQEIILTKDYQEKLVLNGEKIQDPATLKRNWIGEEKGLPKWPSIYFYDIAKYLEKNLSTAISQQVFGDYKEGKAYRYFSCGWVKEVWYHELPEDSTYCILKCRVVPSQRVTSKPYHVWAIVKGDISNEAGNIFSAHCTRTAGLLGACNHILGMLFRVESAVMAGLTKMSCTERLSKWNVPHGKATDAISSKPVSSLIFAKTPYVSSDRSKKRKLELAEKHRGYMPMTKAQYEEMQDKSKFRAQLYSKIKGFVPQSCFVELYEGEKKSVDGFKPSPQTLLQAAETIVCNNKHERVTVDEFLTNYVLNEADVETIFTNTLGQSKNPEWFSQKQWRITASNFHKVFTKSKTLKTKPDTDTTSILNIIQGNTKGGMTKAMRYGISMEVHAKKCYISQVKLLHKGFVTKESGLLVSREHAYLGVSTDLDVYCVCCGSGHCEIKCPISISHTVPSESNLPYLEVTSNGVQLKANCDYYFQIQGQMGVSGKLYTDFFVYTQHGHFLQRISFDPDFWKGLLSELMWFWKTVIGPALLKSVELSVEDK